MKLNKNSWYNKLYNAMWEEYIPQQSLCPYFWKLVICFLTIIPVFIIAFIPLVISNLFIKDNIKEVFKFECVIINLLITTGTLLIINMILVFFPYILNNEDLFGVGITCWTITILLTSYGLGVFIQKQINKNKNVKEKLPKSDSLLKVTSEFIKAKYNKYCPTIEWVGDKKNYQL